MKNHFYIVSKLGMEEDYSANDYEEDLGSFETCVNAQRFFDTLGEDDVFQECYYTEFRVEECEEDDDGVYCIDIVDSKTL